MSHHERTGFRSLVYSGWHRVASIRTLIGPVRAAKLSMIDIDSCEACAYCDEPVALIETEHTARAKPKHAPITALLAWKAGIPAYSVAYSGSIKRSHCGHCTRDDEQGEIHMFHVRQIQPESAWTQAMTPLEYAEFLELLREGHRCASWGREAA